jgi:hypothetical protein
MLALHVVSQSYCYMYESPNLLVFSSLACELLQCKLTVPIELIEAVCVCHHGDVHIYT